jgi:multiple RNA-binding domain-containing protein 1
MFTGLPSDLTDERFRAKLTAPKELEALNVTDVRLKSKRRFAFVGYKTPTEAKIAQEYFHRSYAFGNERIQVHVVDDKVSCRWFLLSCGSS